MKVSVEEKRIFFIVIPTSETTVNFNFIVDTHQEALLKTQKTLAEALQQVTELIGGGRA